MADGADDHPDKCPPTHIGHLHHENIPVCYRLVDKRPVPNKWAVMVRAIV